MSEPEKFCTLSLQSGVMPAEEEGRFFAVVRFGPFRTQETAAKASEKMSYVVDKWIKKKNPENNLSKIEEE